MLNGDGDPVDTAEPWYPIPPDEPEGGVTPYIYTTILDAREAIETACHDTAADFGDEAVEAGYFDILDAVLADATPSVRAEINRQEGRW